MIGYPLTASKLWYLKEEYVHLHQHDGIICNKIYLFDCYDNNLHRDIDR